MHVTDKLVAQKERDPVTAGPLSERLVLQHLPFVSSGYTGRKAINPQALLDVLDCARLLPSCKAPVVV